MQCYILRDKPEKKYCNLQYCPRKLWPLLSRSMARLISEIQFTGSLGNLSAYQMRGEKSVILRTKGGPSRRLIKTSKKFDLVRRYNAEFGGRSTAAGS
jgi:hypothetical protein